MRIAALLSPGAVGRQTENGALVGAITIEGTLALVLFGGLFAGIVAGVVWVVVSPWLPGSGRRRGVATALVAIGLASFFLVRPDNRDFVVLDADGPIVVLLVVLVGLVGAATAWFDAALERRLPLVSGDVSRSFAGYVVIVLLGAATAPLAISFFATTNGCGCADPPTPIGLAMVALGAATAAWWALRIAGPRTTMPPSLLVVGRTILLVAVGLGTARLVLDAGRILDAA